LFSQTSAPSLFFFYFTPTLTLLCHRPQLWLNYPSCWKMFMCCALVFVSCLSLSPNFYEHDLESQIPSFLEFAYFLLHLIKDFWITPKVLNFKLFSMMFEGMLHLSTSGIFNMVSKQLRNVSTPKKHGSKWVYFSRWWI
jgi:hypothetical protein